jgi:hypothetical protein
VCSSDLIFDAYVGKYDGGNGLMVVITREGDKLYIQAATMPKYQLLPASRTEYFLQEVNARLTFNQNSEGKTDSVLINFNGSNIPARRIQ